MAKTTAPKTQQPAPTSRDTQDRGSRKQIEFAPGGGNFGNATVGMAITMAWQLAVIVIVPVLVGHFIDDKTGQTPRWTTVGAIIATIGMIVVVRNTVREINDYMSKHLEDGLDNGKDTKDGHDD